MPWEPSSNLLFLEEEEDKEEAIALMGCTGRGQSRSSSERPTLLSMQSRLPSAAKVLQKSCVYFQDAV